MRKVNVVGKIINLFPVRTFERQGKTNKVANFIMADETSNVKVVLWDTNHIELIENGKITEGSSVEILGGSIRDNEIHLGSFSDLKPSDEEFKEVKTERVVKEKTISEFKPRDSVSVRAFIVQAFDPRFFHVCPECKKKVVLEGDKYTCQEHGNVPAEKRALINIVIDDGTESIRTVLFNDVLPDLGLTELNDSERLFNQKQDLLGKEMVFSGVVRMNSFFNNPEFIADKVKDVDLDSLINKLESR
jgi:ssDNA-binding replication factor A large subunit